MKKRVDWNAIKAEFMAGASYGALASKYQLSKSTIHKKAQKEGWPKSREKTVEAVETATIKKIANTTASNAAKLERARGLAIDQLIRVLENLPENSGTKTRQMIEQETVEYSLLDIVNALDKLSKSDGHDQGSNEILQSLYDLMAHNRAEN